MPDGNHVTLTAAEVAIIKKLRAADLIEALTWYDAHAWKMLTAVARQLAQRPTLEKQRYRETTNAQR
jgi:hypothetical protein